MLSKCPTDYRNNQKSGAGKPRADKPGAVEGSKKEDPIRKMISKRLKNLVERRDFLQNIHGNTEEQIGKSLEDSIQKGEEMVRTLVEMKCGVEVAIEFTLLTLYDVAILIGTFWY